MSEVKTAAPSAQEKQPASPRVPGMPDAGGAAAPNGPTGPRRKTPNLRRRKTVSRIIWSAVLLAIAAGVVVAVWKVFYAPEPQYYNTDIVRRVDKLTQEVTGWGNCVPVESREVRSEVKGKVLDANGFEGMPVNEGDVLCVLDGSELDKAIEAIDKEIEGQNTAIAKANENIDKIRKDMVETNADQIQQEKEAILYAPFSGKILEVKKQTIGAAITKGTVVGTLVDDSVMILRQYFSYGYVNDIKTGMKASVSIPASMSVVEGSVTNVEKVKNIQPDGTVTFEVEISIKNPGALTKKMAATATLQSASGESILPAGAGELEYCKEEVVSAGANGNLKVFNLRDYHEYKQGELLLQVEFNPDNTELEGFLSTIETQEEAIKAAQQTIEEKQAAKAEQQLLYDKLTVTAPMSGTLLMFSANIGQTVDESVVICNIAQMDKMIVEANIEQVNLQYFSVGMPVEVSVNGFYDESAVGVPGTVRSISLTGKNDYGYVTYPCQIEVDNSSGQLPNGAGVGFRATLAESEGALVASIEVIKPLMDGECVFVKLKERPENAIDLPESAGVPDGFYAVPVTVGITSRVLNKETYLYDDVVEITSGVEEGWELHRQKLNVKPSPSPSPSEDGIDGPIDGEPGVDDPGILDPGTDDPGVIDPGTDDPGTIDSGVDDTGELDPDAGTDDAGDVDAGSDPDKDAGASVGDDGGGSVVVGGSDGVVVEPMPMPVG